MEFLPFPNLSQVENVIKIVCISANGNKYRINITKNRREKWREKWGNAKIVKQMEMEQVFRFRSCGIENHRVQKQRHVSRC